MIYVFAAALLSLSVFSYTQIPRGFFLLNNPLWTGFQNTMTRFGSGQGSLLAIVYFVLITALFMFHLYALRNVKRVSLTRIVTATSGILFLSYPFLSQDIFNYYFYSKILTFYHLNPFVSAPIGFADEPLLNYVVLPERTTFYGPTFVVLSAIPSILAMGNFLAFYILYKTMTVASYVLGVYILNRQKKEWAVFFATSPIILIEGVVNLHNDIIVLTMTLAGAYYIFRGAGVAGRLIMLAAGLVKYISLPFIFITNRKNSIGSTTAIIILFAVFIFASFVRGVSPWYLMAFYSLIPLWYEQIRRYQFFYFGSLIGYVYFIEHGDWLLSFFYTMMFGSLVINFVYNTTNGFLLRRGQKN